MGWSFYLSPMADYGLFIFYGFLSERKK